MQSDKNKVLFNRAAFSVFSVLANIRSASCMTRCGSHTAGDALKTVSTEKNPFTENLEGTNMYLVMLQRHKDRHLRLTKS